MQEIIDFDTAEDITNDECMRDIARAALETREAGVLAKPLEEK